MKKLAVVSARGLGDGLIWLTLSYHLGLLGFDVTTFNPYLCDLQRWFPGQKLSPLPGPDKSNVVFNAFDEIIAADHSILAKERSFGNKLKIVTMKQFDKNKSYVENLFRICQRENELTFFSIENGMRPLKGLHHRKHKRRVVIHSMSSDPAKTWPQEKFLQLGSALKERGFHPIFAMSKKEREEWKEVKGFEIPLFSNLSETASYIYESGFFIGNDSGLGHLASNLQIPSISLFARKSHSKLWRPSWGLNQVVTPLPFLIGAPLKQKYWKELLPVWRVLRRVKRWEKELSLSQ